MPRSRSRDLVQQNACRSSRDAQCHRPNQVTIGPRVEFLKVTDTFSFILFFSSCETSPTSGISASSPLDAIPSWMISSDSGRAILAGSRDGLMDEIRLSVRLWAVNTGHVLPCLVTGSVTVGKKKTQRVQKRRQPSCQHKRGGALLIKKEKTCLFLFWRGRFCDAMFYFWSILWCTQSGDHL